MSDLVEHLGPSVRDRRVLGVRKEEEEATFTISTVTEP